MSDLRLWTFRTSPFSGRVRAVLQEKGLEAEMIEVHPARDKRPARLRELNPLNRVPVLELPDGTVLRESMTICEWLEETHPEPPLWPADPALKAWLRGWVLYLDNEILGTYFLGMRKFAFGKDPGDPEDITQRLHARTARSFAFVERALAEHDGPWLAGEMFTLADMAALPFAVRVAEWTPQLATDVPDAPLTQAWLEALRARPSAAAIDTKGERAEA